MKKQNIPEDAVAFRHRPRALACDRAAYYTLHLYINRLAFCAGASLCAISIGNVKGREQQHDSSLGRFKAGALLALLAIE